MTAFGDGWILLAYVLTIGSALLCVVYGLLNWNKPVEDQDSEIREEQEWEAHDPELNEGDQV